MTVASSDATTPRSDALDEVQAGLRQLLGAERRLRGRDQHRTQRGLSHAQIRALFAIDRHEATAGEIAKKAQLSPASTTAMLDDLEGLGIIARRRSETDRRNVLVVLTDEGRAVLASARADWRARWERALADTPDDELRAAAGVLAAIAGLLDEL